MYIVPGNDYKTEKLKFSFNQTSSIDEGFELQLYFEDPKFISSSIDRDTLVIQLDDLRDNEGKLIVEHLQLKKALPNQVDSETAENIAVASEVAASGVASTLSFNFVLNLLMNTSMNQMIGSIKILQVVIHLALLVVVIPANAGIFLQAINAIVAFDFYDTTEYTDAIFGLQAKDADHEELPE